MLALAPTRAVAGPDATGAGNQADLPAPVAFTMPTPPSANALFKNVKGIGRVKTAIYDDFVRRGVTAIRGQRVPSIVGCVVLVIGVERMSGTADIDNRLKAMLDTIVEAGVLTDDRFVTAIAASWLPMANGLAHVQIHRADKPLALTFHPSSNGATGGWFSNAPQPEQEEPF
jgi:Holliday junction resolvase RusA-like endonuclease